MTVFSTNFLTSEDQTILVYASVQQAFWGWVTQKSFIHTHVIVWNMYDLFFFFYLSRMQKEMFSMTCLAGDVELLFFHIMKVDGN